MKNLQVVKVSCDLVLPRDDYNLLEATRAQLKLTHSEFYSSLLSGFADQTRNISEEIKAGL